jgi:dipeptidyl aminopeptidase/acylaminoacyl peptidase
MMASRFRLAAPLLCFLLLHSLEARAAEFKKLAAFQMPCASESQLLSASGDKAALTCPDHRVVLVSLPSGATLREIPAEPKILATDLSNDGRWFAALHPGGAVEIVPTSDKDSSAPLRQINLAPDTRRINFLPDATGLEAVRADATAEIWDIRGAPRKLATLQNEFGSLTGGAFSPNGKVLVTAAGDTVIRYYDTASWKLLHEYRGLLLETFTVAFTLDGKHVLLGGAYDQVVELDISGAEQRRIQKDPDVPAPIQPFGGSGQALVQYFDPDGKTKDYRAIWDPETGKSARFEFGSPITSTQVVHGRLWFASAKEDSLEVFEYH